MLEPSKPRPSVKMSSLYSVSVVVKCCQAPGRSVNLKSTSLTSWSLIILLTSDGVLSLGILLGLSRAVDWVKNWRHREHRRGFSTRQLQVALRDSSTVFEMTQACRDFLTRLSRRSLRCECAPRARQATRTLCHRRSCQFSPRSPPRSPLCPPCRRRARLQPSPSAENRPCTRSRDKFPCAL